MPLEFQTALPPPRLRNSSPRNPPSPSEFQEAARGMVWIFSGITHLETFSSCIGHCVNSVNINFTLNLTQGVFIDRIYRINHTET